MSKDISIDHLKGAFAADNLDELISDISKDAYLLLTQIDKNNKTSLELIAEAGYIERFKPAIDKIDMPMLLHTRGVGGNVLLLQALRKGCFSILRDKINICTEELLIRTGNSEEYPVISTII